MLAYTILTYIYMRETLGMDTVFIVDKIIMVTWGILGLTGMRQKIIERYILRNCTYTKSYMNCNI